MKPIAEQGPFASCPPSLLGGFFTLQSKLVAQKQGHGAEKASAGKKLCPKILLGFRRMGRAARAPGRAPLLRKTPLFGKRTVCPPCTILGKGPARSKKRGGPHGFFAPCPCFWAGHGLKFDHLYAYVGKSGGGKPFASCMHFRDGQSLKFSRAQFSSAKNEGSRLLGKLDFLRMIG